jgi:hypothetical protein
MIAEPAPFRQAIRAEARIQKPEARIVFADILLYLDYCLK